MNSKGLIIPIGAALTTLLATATEAAKAPTETRDSLPNASEAPVTNKELRNPILQELMFRIGEEAHTLTLHRSTNGILYAGHGSHRSHSSHRSHRSGR